MISAILTLFKLRWTQTPQFHPLPPGVTRTFTAGPAGDLELLVSTPTGDNKTDGSAAPTTRPPPILFVHGGCGSASVWLDWMTYLRPRYGARSYAVSLRGHGASTAPGYVRMVFGTGLDDVAADLAAAVGEVKARERGVDPVIVAHSAGGGLAQYVLARREVRSRGLVLVGAVPFFGILDVYVNWWRADRWFPLRSLLHLYHPNSPLSTVELVRGAFFGPEFKDRGEIREFMRWMPSYESMGWPIGLSGSFVKWWKGKNEWLSAADIVGSLVGSEKQGNDEICVMVGSKEMMMDMNMSRRVVREYREALSDLKHAKKVDQTGVDSDVVVEDDIKGIHVERQQGVQLVVVENAGHHTQNDVQRFEAAEALKRFVEQL